jgi:hypothetical protein
MCCIIGGCGVDIIGYWQIVSMHVLGNSFADSV